MDPYDPILDQPQVIEFGSAAGHFRHLLANQDILFSTDANSNLYELRWPWADERYVRSILMRIHDPIGEEMMTLVTRYYPGYQETILGNEGMIISKRITAPLSSHYDRAALWTLECQAEGDRLLRLDIEIDWGEPLTQRIVDGLLVAQINPRRAQGIYKQRNADRTCVFGNPQGRPTSYEFDDDGKATLTYYVLVNGIVEVPLLLTVSDVGEQVAWSGFLALRDAEREFELSVKEWDQMVKVGRLWTSNPQFNRAVQEGRLLCLRSIQRTRTGLTPTSRLTEDVPAIVDCLDTFDVTLSRNLLAHMRRVAEKGEGRVPVQFPVRPKDPILDPARAVVSTNFAYLAALERHLSRHPDLDLLQKHMRAVALCAECLVMLRNTPEDGPTDDSDLARIGESLVIAAKLAGSAGDDANEARWESEARLYRTLSRQEPQTLDASVEQRIRASGWHCPGDAPCSFTQWDGGILLAGEAAWSVTGLEWQTDGLWVYPKRMPDISWWALVDFPIGDDALTMVWDGAVLHTTAPVQSDQPVRISGQIYPRDIDEHRFDLWFEMVPTPVPKDADSEDRVEETAHFRPQFDNGDGDCEV